MSVAPTRRTGAPRWQRALIWLVGIVAAVVMVALGLWQMRVFSERGEHVAAERATLPAVDLLERIPAGGEVGDVYGRRVTVAGTYVPDEQVLVVDRDGTRRVLSGLLLADGRVVPVVRGTVTAAELPTAPVGLQAVEGVFLPSEAGAEHRTPPGTLGSVRLPLLAQQWPQQLAPGFVTIDPERSAAQGLGPAHVELPSESGAVRNLGYAMQWWAFAVFALVMAAAITRSMRPKDVDSL